LANDHRLTIVTSPAIVHTHIGTEFTVTCSNQRSRTLHFPPNLQLLLPLR
jgi:hypothetical protein